MVGAVEATLYPVAGYTGLWFGGRCGRGVLVAQGSGGKVATMLTYCDGVQIALDSETNLSCSPEMLYRACQIAHGLGWKDPEGSRLKSLFRGIIQDAYDREDHWGFMEGAERSWDLKFSIDDPADLAKKAEKLAVTNVPDAPMFHNLRKFAKYAYHKACK